LAEIIAIDDEPFDIVNRKGFVRYSFVMDPKYNLPNRTTDSERISKLMVIKSALKNFDYQLDNEFDPERYDPETEEV
jgi:hypothetical protein